MNISHVIACVFAVLGLIFLAIGVFGVIKFPGFNSRLHASGVGETVGTLLLTISMMIMAGLHLVSLKILVVFIILLFTNPLGTNLIMMEAIHALNYHGYNDKRHGDVIDDSDEEKQELEALTESESRESTEFVDMYYEAEKKGEL